MAGQYFTTAGMMWLFSRAFSGTGAVAFTGDTTSSSTSVASVSSVTGLSVGMVIVGAGIPAGTTIAAVGSTTITLSAAATATATGVDLWAWGDGALLDVMTLHLLTGTVEQSPTTAWSALTEANFDGYAAVTLPAILTAISSPQAGWVTVSAGCQTWIPTDYVVPNNVTGIAWTYPGAGAAGPQLIATEVFENIIPVANVGDMVQLIPILSVALDSTSGPSSPVL